MPFTVYDYIAIGRLCEKCDGRCVICDSYVRPHALVHICDECNYGSFEVFVLLVFLNMLIVLLVYFIINLGPLYCLQCTWSI